MKIVIFLSNVIPWKAITAMRNLSQRGFDTPRSKKRVTQPPVDQSTTYKLSLRVIFDRKLYREVV
jgi:hypothetical protein